MSWYETCTFFAIFLFFAVNVLFYCRGKRKYEISRNYSQVRYSSQRTKKKCGCSRSLLICQGKLMIFHIILSTIANLFQKLLCNSMELFCKEWKALINSKLFHRLITTIMLWNIILTVLSMMSKPIFLGAVDDALPMKNVISYRITSKKLYWLTYFHQSSAMMIAAVATIAYDGLISGFMMLICAKLKILKSRLRNLANLNAVSQRESIRKCIQQHNDTSK